VRQLDELFPFELEWQVAGIGVLIGSLLDERRIVPGLRWAPISQAPERCKSPMNSKASGVLLTGKSRTKVGRTPYLSKIRCARSWHFTELTPLARRGRGASQSNSASVSTTTTSIGLSSAGQWIVLQVLGSSMPQQYDLS
jgi:hypothetical protein